MLSIAPTVYCSSYLQSGVKQLHLLSVKLPGELNDARAALVRRDTLHVQVPNVRASRSRSQKNRTATSAAREMLNAGMHGDYYANPLQNPAIRQPIHCGSCHSSQIRACQKCDRRS